MAEALSTTILRTLQHSLPIYAALRSQHAQYNTAISLCRPVSSTCLQNIHPLVAVYAGVYRLVGMATVVCKVDVAVLLLVR